MKFWFVLPLAMLMLSPIWLERMESRMDGIAEGGVGIPADATPKVGSGSLRATPKVGSGSRRIRPCEARPRV